MIERRNPYVGPRAFESGELLFGRDREVRELVGMLISDRIVMLYSPSGAGKTSLIDARLRQVLEREGLEVLPILRVSTEPRPDEQDAATKANRYLLGTLLSLDHDRRVPITELVTMTLDEYLRRSSSSDRPQVMIFDQFEEILTLDPTDQGAKEDFFGQVGAALRDRQRWALFSIREDYVGALEPFVPYIPTRLRTVFRLDLLSQAAARLAIQEPARCRGVEFCDEAASLLVDDLRTMLVQRSDGTSENRLGPFIEPVQLQVVCYRLWEDLPSDVKVIDKQYIDPAGDVDAALAGYYSDWMKKLAGRDSTKERSIRIWCEDCLLTDQGTRGQVLMNSGKSQGLDNKIIESLVKDAHLVRAEVRRGAQWFELAHDRLIGPVKSNNASWLAEHLNEFQRQATLWFRQGRPKSVQLTSFAIKEWEPWAFSHEAELTQFEREFLEACRDSRKDAEQLEQRLNIEAKLDREKQKKLRFRRLFYVSLAMFLLIASLATYAMRQASDARLAEKKAELAAKLASQETAEAKNAQQKEAQALKELAQKNQQALYYYSRHPLSPQQLSEADAALQLIASQKTLDDRRKLRVLYYTKDPHSNIVSQLTSYGFQVGVMPSKFDATNAVWYGPGVETDDVQMVVLTLIQKGVIVQRVASFRNRQREAGTISIGTDTEWLLADPVTVKKISALQLQSELVPLDILGYCRRHGFTGVKNLDGTGYGWRCTPSDRGINGDGVIDGDEACREQYGSLYLSHLTSPPPGGPNDWTCTKRP